MTDSFLKEITILIVEDAEVDRKILVNILEKYFPKILEASDGEIAYQLFKSHKNIDIIISDINMPKISGLDFLKLVRQSDLKIPFICITGGLQPEIIFEAINLNVNSYLTKPIDARLLLEKIDFLCERKYERTQLENKRKEIEYYYEAIDKAALIFRMDGNGKILYMNNAMLDVSQYSKNEINRLNFDDIIHPDIPKKYIKDAWAHVKEGKLWKGNTKFISKNHKLFYLNNTIFKLNNENEEFLTIAFLTTKEILDKREFHKRVIMKFQEANKKEFELKEENSILKKKLNRISELYEEDKIIINSLKDKHSINLRQLQHYEIQGDLLTKKYDKFMSAKKEELETYIKSLNLEKQKNEKMILKQEELSLLVEQLRERNMSLEEDVRNKNRKINNLNEIIAKKGDVKSKKTFFH